MGRVRTGLGPNATRDIYLTAVAQLVGFLRDRSAELDAAEAVEDPTGVTKAHAEAFQAWMIETRSPATAVTKRTGLVQFFKWLVEDEEELDRSPRERIRRVLWGLDLLFSVG